MLMTRGGRPFIVAGRGDDGVEVGVVVGEAVFRGRGEGMDGAAAERWGREGYVTNASRDERVDDRVSEFFRL